MSTSAPLLARSTSVLKSSTTKRSVKSTSIPLAISSSILPDFSTPISPLEQSSKIIEPSPSMVSTTKVSQDRQSTTVPVIDTSSALLSTVIDATIRVTTNTPASLITNVQCNPGFVKCSDGRCEPFELLCENGLAATLPTLPTEPTKSTAGTSNFGLMTSTSRTPILSSYKPTSLYLSSMQGNTAASTAAHVVTIPPQTSGQCHVGFVQCTDGRCEPFEQLCGEVGYVTLPTIKPEITTSTTGPQTNSLGVIITSPTGPPPSTLPTMIATLPLQPAAENPSKSIATENPANVNFPRALKALENGCPPGFELCPDKKCEPFHFMCDEHIAGELVGR